MMGNIVTACVWSFVLGDFSINSGELYIIQIKLSISNSDIRKVLQAHDYRYII